METVKVSKKYQVVIPKKLREGLNIKPGQKVRIMAAKNGKVQIDTMSIVDAMYGSMKGAWGKDSDTYLRELRNEANRNRA